MDNIIVPPTIHLIVGTIVLLANLFFLVVVGLLAWQKSALSAVGKAAFILFQVVLMVQVLIGIKLLDQGLGIFQLYIHYLGGLAPMAFCLLFYWLPTKDGVKQSRRLAVVASVSFVFMLLTFVVGSIATAGIG
ncbi:MAG: hypothetical protein KF753_21640 [Caldilineaceae bacterium]|nr:hypothetical protein [Caldilineaceae bacterium]